MIREFLYAVTLDMQNVEHITRMKSSDDINTKIISDHTVGSAITIYILREKSDFIRITENSIAVKHTAWK